MSFSRQQRIVDHFRRSIESYDNGAVVQKKVSEDLLAALADLGCTGFSRVLEIGCCTGSMTESLCRRFAIERLWLNDLVAECCQRTRRRIAGRVEHAIEAIGDIETLELPQDLDLIISSSTFQWLLDLPGFFRRCAGALDPDGILAFTMFGPGTMMQLRELIGVGLNYPSSEAIQEMLTGDFSLLRVDSSAQTLYFQTPREVLRHIQQTGVGGAGCHSWTPAGIRRFEQEYFARFGNERGVPLDYASICIVARKLGDGS